MALKFHPLADIFPLMTEAELAGLVEDIKENGLRDPIILHESMILDGRNRHAACLKAGVEPISKRWDGHGDPLGFVVSKNLHRRHLDQSQRSMVAGKVANMRQGERSDLPPIGGRLPPISQTDAAKMLNVSERSISRARSVLERGVPELKAAVESGNVSLWAADEIAHCPKEEQQMVVAKGSKEVAKAAEKKRSERQSRATRRDGKKDAWPNARRERERIEAEIYATFKEAFELLTSLPLPDDVARIARAKDKHNFVDVRLIQAKQWIGDFSDAWENRRENSAQQNRVQTRDDEPGQGDQAA